MKHLKAFHSHIELSPYVSGECIKLERLMSAIDKTTFKRKLQAYEILGDTLYLPRGISLRFLDTFFDNIDMTVNKECDKYDRLPRYNMTKPPKNKIQEDAISFLTGTNDFNKTRSYSQKMLTLDTGDGKTYSAIKSIVDLGYKAIIITHVTKIKNQWISSFLEMTDIPKERLCNIDSSTDIEKIINNKKYGDIYFINHGTIQSFAKKYGWEKLRTFFTKIGIGIKVIDEVHYYLENTFRIDMFTNCKLSIYLTATPKRSDPIEDIIFRKAFSSCAQFGMETRNDESKRKHIVYMPILFNSMASSYHIANMYTRQRFSPILYCDYAFNHDSQENMMLAIDDTLERINKLDGKVLITASKIEAIEHISKHIYHIDLNKSISTIHSKHSETENEEAKASDIIISTVSGGGTGFDVRGLRCLVNTEPFCSSVTFEQLKGRLREFNSTDDTYFFDLIDISIPKCKEFYKLKLKYAKAVCKKIIIDDHLLKMSQ